jgi:hypothetical protein
MKLQQVVKRTIGRIEAGVIRGERWLSRNSNVVFLSLLTLIDGSRGYGGSAVKLKLLKGISYSSVHGEFEIAL